MLENEPLNYPSRSMDRFPFDPGVTNRQLWALGMIVVQWSMTELFLDTHTRQLIRSDPDLVAELNARRNFRQRLEFWEGQVRRKLQDPVKSAVLEVIPRIQNLNSQRDEVIHRAWGGGIEPLAWSAGGIAETNDAHLLTQPEEIPQKQRLSSPQNLLSWNITFNRMRRIASEMATLNRDLLVMLSDGPDSRSS